MRISLFEFVEAILLKIFDAFLSEIASKIAVLETASFNILQIIMRYHKFLVGEINKKSPAFVIFLVPTQERIFTGIRL